MLYKNGILKFLSRKRKRSLFFLSFNFYGPLLFMLSFLLQLLVDVGGCTGHFASTLFFKFKNVATFKMKACNYTIATFITVLPAHL